MLQEAAARATLIDIIDKPRRDGVDVFFNVIAFTPSVSHQVPIARELLGPELALPPWMKELTVDTLSEKLKDRTFRDKVKEVLYSGRIKFYMVHPLTNPYWMDCFTVVRCKNKEFEGRTIGEIARQRGSGRTVDTVYNKSVEVVFDLLVEDPRVTWAVSLDVRENPGALPVFLQHPAGMPCADTWSMPARPEGFTDWNSPLEPPAYGLYPHYLQTFVNEQHVLSLEEAVRKATMLPAQVMGLKDRGTICPGAYADMVVFDPDEIGMRGDFTEPHRPPGGIELVLVNGQVAYEKMRHTGVRAGKVLRRQ
jgi:N-acyl-D-aspartate/D-glutamate deacylase